MDKTNRIDEFLVVLETVLSYEQFHSNDEIFECIFDYTTRYDIKEQEFDYKSVFEYWAEKFKVFYKNNYSIKKDDWFTIGNRTSELEKQSEHIKLYIPLNEKHIKYGVEKIIDFLEQNDIAYECRVGKNITNTNISIILNKREDTEKLQKFIDSDEFIQRGLMSPYLFAFHKNRISYVCDHNSSYTYTVSRLLKDYLDSKKEHHDKKVSFKGFYNYIDNLLDLMTLNGPLSELFQEYPFNDFYKISSLEEKKENIMRIIKLILYSSKSFSIDDFYNFYEENKKIYEKYNYTNDDDYKKNNEYTLTDSDLEEFMEELYIDVVKKNGLDKAKLYISQCIKSLRIKKLINDDEKFDWCMKHNFYYFLNEYLNKKLISLDDYLSSLENSYIANYGKDIENNTIDYVKNAIEETLNAHGINHVIGAIKFGFEDRNYQFFSRNNEARFTLNLLVPLKDFRRSICTLTSSEYTDNFEEILPALNVYLKSIGKTKK